MSFAHDMIEGVSLLQGEKILRITPCRLKTFSQVKDCVIYTTNQRLVCLAKSAGVAGTLSKLRGRETTETYSIIPLPSVTKAMLSNRNLTIAYTDEEKRSSHQDFVIGSVAIDLGDFIMTARRGLVTESSSPLVDEYDATEVKSTVGRGLSITGKVLYKGAKVGAKVTYEGAKVGVKISNQLYQQYLKESESDFEGAAEEEDSRGWSSYSKRGPKGRKAESRVAEALKMTGWTVVGRNIPLQSREIDIVAQKGSRKYMLECKFGKKQIDTAALDGYVMLYYNAKQSLRVNGLLFVCPTAGLTEHARGNVLVKYPNENIQVLDSRGWFRRLEDL